MHCEKCHVRLAIMEEKIFHNGKFFHRRCLAAAKKILIKDRDLSPIFIKGVYNVYTLHRKRPA
jgi:hypothetical protein